MRKAVACAASLVASAICAQAATITVQSAQNDNEPAVVLIDGDLKRTDADDFRSVTNFLSKAIILFRSDGGSLVAGIEIGESIRLKGFTTFVARLGFMLLMIPTPGKKLEWETLWSGLT
jgi:hypothetical protein